MRHFLLARNLGARSALVVLLVGFMVMTAAATLRGTEYDENYTMFLAAGTPRPAWPAEVFTAASVRHVFSGHSTAAGIAHDLRTTDVHPPLYFWAVAAWRGVFGTGLLVTRMASVVFSLAAVLCIGAIAVETGVPPVLAMLLTIGCYGFSYTGAVARGFALAQLLGLAGVAVLLLAERRAGMRAGRAVPVGLAFAGGLLMGLASFANYLTAFVAAAALLWLLLRRPRDVALWLAGGIGFALMLPPDLWFFLAQRNSRVGQFPPFHLAAALLRLAEYATANVFGGLPLYLPRPASAVVGGLVALLLVAIAGVIAWRWRCIGGPGARLLFALGAAALPVGLLLLGFVFDNTPIELRYVAFSMPFFGLLTAGALASLADRPLLPGLMVAAIFAVQAVSLAGMVSRPETMQPQAAVAHAAAAAAAAGTVVLLPRGNDGVGVVAAFVNEAPDDLHILVVDPADTSATLLAKVGGYRRVVLALLGLDADSKAALPLMSKSFETAACWRAAPAAGEVQVFDQVCP